MTKHSIRYLKVPCITFLFIFAMLSVSAQRYMEDLNRGTHAIRTNASTVLVSWRILGTEYNSGATYNLYRDGSLIGSNLSVSNFEDNTSTNGSYTVSAVIGGVEGPQSAAVSVWANFYNTIPLNIPPGGTTPDNVSYTYEPNDLSVGDLDGDGDYEIVVKWYPTNAKDNANSGYTGNTILEGIELDGTSLWKIDLGINIRSGAHYTQFMVYDLDGDGDAEVACKTADGTVDGLGNVLGSSTADYRNTGGYILDGPEYLTIFDGNNGAELATTGYTPARGNVAAWGDSYGNRVDRLMACIAYLDGSRPSLVMTRGIYTRVALTAYDFRNGSLTQRWAFDTNHDSSNPYEGQGNHNLAVGDVDGDGKDEIMYGACAIDDDGTGLYSTGFGHGDAGHLLDIDPNEPGLEFYMPHETANGTTRPGMSIRNAATGAMLWTVMSSGDIGRGLAMDIDSNHPGMEVWSSDGTGVYDKNGNLITTTYPKSSGSSNSYNFGAWWTGDLQREILDRTVLNKWNSSTFGSDRLVTLYNYEGATTNNSTKDNPGLVADILGDWREEIILRSYTNDKLVVFTTTYPTSQRMYTLMHDPIYRLSIAWQNVGYNQPPHLGFYFGGGMSTPPNPDIQLVASCPSTAIVPYMKVDDQSWTQTNEVTISQGSTVILGPHPTSGGSWSWTGCGTAGSSREQTITPSSSCVATATYTNSAGCISSLDFKVNIKEELLHYAFDETSGTTAYDSTGNGYDGTVVGGATFGSGHSGNAIVLDGADDHVVAPTGIVNGLNDFTIATWVNLDTADMWSRIFDFGSGTSAYMFMTPYSGDGTFRYAISLSGGAGEQQVNSTSPLPSGSWSHVAVTQSANVATLYVDGVPVGSSSNMSLTPTSLGNTANNYIGRSQYPDPYLNGKVDDFRIYNYALDSTEIAGLVSATVPTASLIIQEDDGALCLVEGSIDTNHSGYTGSGFANTSNKSGKGIDWAVNAPNAESYSLVWRYALSGNGSRNARVLVNGIEQLSNVDFPATDGWGNWGLTSSVSVSLAAGNNTIRLESVSNGGLSNIDYLEVSGNSPQQGTCSAGTRIVSGILESVDQKVAVYPIPATDEITVDLPGYTGNEDILIMDISGRILMRHRVTGKSNSIDIQSFKNGAYLLRIENGEYSKSIMILKH